MTSVVLIGVLLLAAFVFAARAMIGRGAAKRLNRELRELLAGQPPRAVRRSARRASPTRQAAELARLRAREDQLDAELRDARAHINELERERQRR